MTGVDFEILKKETESYILPYTSNLAFLQRDRIRNEIRYSKDEESLSRALAHASEIIGELIFLEDIKEKFNFKLKEEKEEGQDQSVLQLLDHQPKKILYLDLGYSQEKDIWWYGFNLNGKEAIITSDGKILRNIREKIKYEDGKDKFVGENEIKEIFDYSSYIGDIAPIIDNETIKKFYQKSGKNDLVSPKEVYKNIRNKFLYYMDFSGKEEIADVMTCWIIATYCYPIFNWFPHILVNAPSGSGKTKFLTIIKQLAFRGFDIGASAGVTPAQIFRTLESNRGTTIFDEFEQDVSTESKLLVNQIINASPTKDAYVIRTEQINRKWRAWKFPIFCPKACGNISGINPTSLSRFIFFKWLKTQTEKGKRKPERENDKKSFYLIQQNLYILILENWKKIKEIYDNLDIELTNREADNWLPLFSIARFIDGCEGEEVNAEIQIKKYLEGYNEIQVETEDNTEEFFQILYETLPESLDYYTPKEIANFSGVVDLLSYLKSPPHWIGKKLKLYQFKTNRSGGSRKYLLSKPLVKKIIDVYYTDIIAHNNTNNTQQHKQHTTTHEDVSLGGVCVVTPERSSGDFEEIKMIKELKDA